MHISHRSSSSSTSRGIFVVTNTTSLAILRSRSEVPHAVLWPMLPACAPAGLLRNLIGLWFTRRLPGNSVPGRRYRARDCRWHAHYRNRVAALPEPRSTDELSRR